MELTRLVEGTEIGEGAIVGETEVDDTETAVVDEPGVDAMETAAEISESSVPEIGESSVSAILAEGPSQLPPSSLAPRVVTTASWGRAGFACP